MSDQAIEQEIVAKGLTAPRITPEHIESVISHEHTFTVVGKSACASPENFDSEIGAKIARNDAIEKIWPLEGYLLKDRLSQSGDTPD